MKDTAEYYIRCIHCGAKNKLNYSRIGLNPACGKCKQQLFSDYSPIRSDAIIARCRQCQTSNKIPVKKIGEQTLCGKCKSPLHLNLTTQGNSLVLSDQNFTETVLRSPLPFLVNFHSPNCGPCKLLNPIISKIARDYEGRLMVGTFDVDVNQYIPTLYRVGGTPTLLIFQSGKELGRLEGYQSSGAVTNWIRPYAW